MAYIASPTMNLISCSLVTCNPEEEHLAFYDLYDIIFEYNERIENDPVFARGKQLLSLRRPVFRGDQTVIAPMSKEEVIEWKSIKSASISKGEGDFKEFKEEKDFSSVMADKFKKDFSTPDGLISGMPIALGIKRLSQVVKELGWRGAIYYKLGKSGNLNVILKGNQKLRSILTGTKYGNQHPKMLKFGLSKVSYAKAFKGTFVVGLAFYGLAKAVEGVEMFLTDGELKASYFSEIPMDVVKIAVSGIIGTGVLIGATAIGLPVAAGIGAALVLGYLAEGAIEYFDEKTGFSKTLKAATQQLVENMEKEWNEARKKLHNSVRRSVEDAVEAAKRALLRELKSRLRELLPFENVLLDIKPMRLNRPVAHRSPLAGLEHHPQLGHQKTMQIQHCFSYTRAITV